MNNIEKLAIQHCNYKGFSEGKLEQVGFSINQLEAFAKALQSSEPVAQVEVRKNRILYNTLLQYAGTPLLDGTLKLFTHPPASVSLEKYNRAIEALKDLFADYKALADSGDAGFWKLEGTEIGKRTLQAIAEAEGKS